MGADAGGRDATVASRSSGGESPRVNQAGDSHCYNCRALDHWAYECPKLTTEQQSQLHMHIKAGEEGEAQDQEGHQLLNVVFMQGEALPDNRAYLDGCLTVTASSRRNTWRGFGP
jgi:hypothetical protein